MRLLYKHDDLSYSEREDLLDSLAEERFEDRRDRELMEQPDELTKEKSNG